jgi:hypothetical protein
MNILMQVPLTGSGDKPVLPYVRFILRKNPEMFCILFPDGTELHFFIGKNRL